MLGTTEQMIVTNEEKIAANGMLTSSHHQQTCSRTPNPAARLPVLNKLPASPSA